MLGEVATFRTAKVQSYSPPVKSWELVQAITPASTGAQHPDGQGIRQYPIQSGSYTDEDLTGR